MNPASTMKLVTTFAALELLGPDYRWKTTAYLDGTLADGVLNGNLVLKGGGDPKITRRAVAGVHGDAARARASTTSRATSCSTDRSSRRSRTIRRRSTASR